MRLRAFAIAYAAAVGIHFTDHLRRGLDASPRWVIALGGITFLLQAFAVYAVVTRHPRAPRIALSVALPLALGVVLVHLLPGGSDALVGANAAPGANAFSVVTAALEVATGLALAWAAWQQQRRVPSSDGAGATR